MKEINGTIIRHDPALSVATAPSRMATKWDNTAMAWSELAERCSSPRRTMARRTSGSASRRS